jgi:hypothetical protein
MRVYAFLLVALFATGCAGGGGRSVPASTSAQSDSSGFKIPAKISAAVPPAPPAMTPRHPSSQIRRTSSGGHPAFFDGEVALANGVYYLALPNGNVFGYYSYLSTPNWIYHQDMGYEFMSDANDGHGGIYFFDSASSDWMFTSRDYPFPYLYDFTLKAMLYYYADTQNAGHYTKNPRYFYNFDANKIITLPGLPVWQTGSSTIGQYDLPGIDDGQCSYDSTRSDYVRPVITGSNASFTVLRNKNKTYNYPDPTSPPIPGASTCWRNQLNPRDQSTGTNYMFSIGSHYTFTFQTVVTLNGNTVYSGVPGREGLAGDIPAIMWQTHSYGQQYGHGPCDVLTIENTNYDSWTGLYDSATVANGGKAAWGFSSCSDPNNHTIGNRYFSADTLHDGEVDNWQIDITAQLVGQPRGRVMVQRNGSVVYNNDTGVCDADATHGCWWNFGPYMELWENTEEPAGWNNAGVTVQFNNMTLLKQ